MRIFVGKKIRLLSFLKTFEQKLLLVSVLKKKFFLKNWLYQKIPSALVIICSTLSSSINTKTKAVLWN